MLSPSPVFVIDGHDIGLYPDVASAAVEIEGCDSPHLDFIGADGTGPQWLSADHWTSRHLGCRPGSPDRAATAATTVVNTRPVSGT